MIPKSLSASALQVWESCPARYVAETLHKTPDEGGIYADLGSACHTALENYVRDVYIKNEREPDLDYLHELFTEAFGDLFGVADGPLFEDGQQMLANWFSQSDNLSDGRQVLSLENKRSFEVKTSAGVILFNYIFDRLDRLEDGSIEVVDYKSVRARLSPEGLKDKIQARCYGVAAQILYPDAPRVWVTFDLLRYGRVGVVFTRDENLATWRYIRRAAEKIIATPEDEAPEKINSECRFCIRKHQCETLRANVDAGSILALEDPIEAAKARAQMDHRIKALTAGIEQLDKFILQQAEHDDVDSYEDEAEGITITIDSRRTRTVRDPAAALALLGPERAGKYAGMTLANLDKALKTEDLTEAERDTLAGMIGYKSGKPSVRVALANPIDE